MRIALTLSLLAILLLPLAAAAPPKPDVPEPPVEAGPCVVNWGYIWPGEAVGADCGRVGASYGTCALGNYLWVRVGTTVVYVGCDAAPL